MRSKLYLVSSIQSNKGSIRDCIEDNFYNNGEFLEESFSDVQYANEGFIEEGEGVFVVCDGLGSDRFGKKASATVVKSLHDYLKTVDKYGSLEYYLNKINRFLSDMNDIIYKMAIPYPDLKGMGTTFAALIIKNKKAAALNLGDSKVYFYREGFLTKLTQEHNEAERMVRLGLITREDAKNHIKRFVLSKYLGLSPLDGKVEGDVSNFLDCQHGDIFILSTDGLNAQIDERKINEILRFNQTPKEIAQSLMNEANKVGANDNLTFLVVKFFEENQDIANAQSAESRGKSAPFMKHSPDQTEQADDASKKNRRSSYVSAKDAKTMTIVGLSILGLLIMSFVMTYLFSKLGAIGARTSRPQTQIPTISPATDPDTRKALGTANSKFSPNLSLIPSKGATTATIAASPTASPTATPKPKPKPTPKKPDPTPKPTEANDISSDSPQVESSPTTQPSPSENPDASTANAVYKQQ